MPFWFLWARKRGLRKARKRRLFFLAVDGVALEEGIKLPQFNTVFLKLFVLCAEVAGWGFALGPCFRAFKDDLFAHVEIMPEAGV